VWHFDVIVIIIIENVQSLSGEIVVGRGVRQGDLLSSPLRLFNYVLDWVLSDLDPQLGVQLEDNVRLNHLAFADDVALVTESPRGAQHLAGQFERGLAEVGLLPNALKSATILLKTKDRRYIC